MKRRRNVIIMLIVFLALGFAAVSTTLVINGLIGIGENKDDFSVIFTKAISDGYDSSEYLISNEGKEINFVTDELSTVGEEYVLDYEVTNYSKTYDADISFTYNLEENDLVDVKYQPTTLQLAAGESKWGKITVRLKKALTEPKELSVNLSLDASALARNSVGNYTKYNMPGMLMERVNESSPSLLDNSLPSDLWNKFSAIVTQIEFENSLLPHEVEVGMSYDVSHNQDGSVMAYLAQNSDILTESYYYYDEEGNENVITNGYTLYLQANNVIYANVSSGYLFSGFKDLREIRNIEYFDTRYATTMAFMFQNCEKLQQVDLSNFDTSNVTTMAYMFYGDSSLSSISIKNLSFDNVEDMSSMFYECVSLTEIDMNGIVAQKLNDISYIFSGCTNLTTADIGNMDIRNAHDAFSFFSDCSNLTTVNMSGTNMQNVESIGYFFCRDEMLSFVDMSYVNFENTIDSSYMFENCRSLSNINLSNLISSSLTNMSNMFYDCNELISLNLSVFDSHKVTDMSNMFSGCYSLKELNLSDFNTSNVTNMSYMFNGCSSLIALDLSNFNTSNITNMTYMFNGCSKLVTLIVSSFDTSKVTNMSNMFARCDELTSLNLTNFDTSNVTNMESMFYSCDKLTELDLSTFITSKVITIGSIFADCSELKSVNAVASTLENVYNAMDATKKVYFSKHSIINNCSDIVIIQSEARHLDQVSLVSSDKSKVVKSFKINGITVNRDYFFMLDKDVVISDVELGDYIVVETDHYPYNNLEMDYYYNKFEGAKSITVEIEYQLYYVNGLGRGQILLYDFIDSSVSRPACKSFTGNERKTESYTVNGSTIRIYFDPGRYNNYYGFKAKIKPNY